MIEESTLSEVLATGLSGGAEFAEVFVEDRRSTSAVLDDGRVEDVATGRDRGAGIRVVVGESTGFAHTTDLSPEGLNAAARTAAAAARDGKGGATMVELTSVEAANPSVVRLFPGDVATSAKVELLGRADRGQGGRIVDQSGFGPLRGQQAPYSGGQLRWCAGVRRPGTHVVFGVGGGQRRHRHADRTRASATRSDLSCLTTTAWRSWPSVPPAGRSSSWTPVRRHRAPAPW